MLRLTNFKINISSPELQNPNAVNDSYKITGSTCDIDAVKETFELAKEINSNLPEWSKNGWRWRISYIRALLDYYRYSGVDINTNEETLSAMHELIDIFHALKTENV